VAVGASLAVVGSWQIATLVDYFRNIFARIPGLFQ